MREEKEIELLTKKAEGQGAGGRGKEGNTPGAKWFQAPGFIHGKDRLICTEIACNEVQDVLV